MINVIEFYKMSMNTYRKMCTKKLLFSPNLIFSIEHPVHTTVDIKFKTDCLKLGVY